MPSDSKRITGPETTIPYHYYLSDFSRKPDFKDPKVGERKNGRLPNEHRPVCKYILLSNFHLIEDLVMV